MNYQDVLLLKIRQNPRNPRKVHEGRNFDELVDSIKRKGVIQPIVIRPIKETKEGRTFEVVAGNRRFVASTKISVARKMVTATIPAMIRDLSDDEAFEFMMIENLQREDLTDLEEAESFKGFIENRKKKGTNGSAIDELGKRIGLNPRYIRSRVDVMSLPKYILKEWNTGKLCYGHLEQLLRVKDGSKLRHAFDWIFEGFNQRVNSVSDLKDEIDEESPDLKYATFARDECNVCPKNSAVQIALWNIGSCKGLLCHDSKCFREKQRKSLKKNWAKSEFAQTCKTTGFQFKEELDWNQWERFYAYAGAFRPDDECKKCSNFLTLLTYFAKVDERQVCVDKACFKRKERAWQNRGKSGEKSVIAGPRVSWHGEFFREEFLTGRLPGKFAEHAPLADDESIRITMFGFISTSQTFKDIFADEMKKQGKIKTPHDVFFKEGNVRIWRLIEKMNMGEVKAWLVKFAEDIILNRSEVSADARFKIAEFLGVKLMEEFAVTEEYLKKKTIKEMLEFGKKSKLFTTTLMMRYLKDTLNKDHFEKCKKAELIDCFLKSGIGLVGKIPAEIVPRIK